MKILDCSKMNHTMKYPLLRLSQSQRLMRKTYACSAMLWINNQALKIQNLLKRRNIHPLVKQVLDYRSQGKILSRKFRQSANCSEKTLTSTRNGHHAGKKIEQIAVTGARTRMNSLFKLFQNTANGTGRWFLNTWMIGHLSSVDKDGLRHLTQT